MKGFITARPIMILALLENLLFHFRTALGFSVSYYVKVLTKVRYSALIFQNNRVAGLITVIQIAI